MIARGIPIEEVEEEMDAKRIRNQFNFSDRASQTLNNPLRVCISLPCFLFWFVLVWFFFLLALLLSGFPPFPC